VAIRAGILGSKAAVKRAAAKGSGGDFAQVLKNDGDSWRVRFLVEPERWTEIFEHFYDGKYRVCDDEVCPACDDGNRRSQRFLVPVLMVDDGKVACIKLAKTAYTALERKYERSGGVLTDRDYEITRHGTGQNDTEYEIEALDKIKVDLSRFKPPGDHKDWESYCFSFVQAMLDFNKPDQDDDDDYEEVPPPKKVVTNKVAPKSSATKTVRPIIRRTS
jgi:hypothetical protein